MNSVFRSLETADLYRAYKERGGLSGECVLCSKTAFKEFTHWKLMENDFPYDLIASRHDMIVPRRHVTESGLTEYERSEFLQIKQNHLQTYNFIIEPADKAKSIPAHFHLHLISVKERF